MAQRVAKQPERAVLELAVKIDQYIAARHKVHLGKHAVGGQAVVREHHVLTQGFVKNHPPVARGVVAGQRAAPTGAGMVLGESGDTRHVEHAGFGRAQGMRVDVGGIDQRAVQQPFFL